MKLALIPPVDLLEHTARTDFQLMLPHLVRGKVLQSGRYAHTYRMHCDDPNQYVILDNGEAEGQLQSIVDLFRIAREYGVDELVIPDEIANAEGTRKRYEQFRRALETHTTAAFVRDTNFMYVLQGTTYEEFVDEALWAIEEDHIDVLGVPRHMIETLKMEDARFRLASRLVNESDKPLHLLGNSPLYSAELADFDWPSNVRSTDTSSPFNYAYSSLFLDDGLVQRRPSGYFNLPHETFNQMCLDRNIQLLQEWTSK